MEDDSAAVAGDPPGGHELTDDDRRRSMLCYLAPVPVAPIVLLSGSGKTRVFQGYHAIQSLGLGAVWLCLLAFLACLAEAITATTGLGGLYVLPVYGLPWLLLYFAVKAYQGEYTRIPLVTEFMVQQGWILRP
jgi:uncharacterized membrane protein